MAGIAMTSDAVDRLAWLNQVFRELADHLTMAVLAVVQHDPRACLAHANRLMPTLKSKRVRVAIAAFYLRCILADQVVWGVAVIARRNRAMAGFLPTGELLAHDVAVRAGRRVIRQIRRAPRVVERVSACPDQYPRQSKRKQCNKWPKVHIAPPCRCLRLLSSYAAPASKALAGWPVSALTFGIKKARAADAPAFAQRRAISIVGLGGGVAVSRPGSYLGRILRACTITLVSLALRSVRSCCAS